MLQTVIYWEHRDRPGVVEAEYNATGSTAEKAFVSYLERYGHKYLSAETIETFDPLIEKHTALSPAQVEEIRTEKINGSGNGDGLNVGIIALAALFLVL